MKLETPQKSFRFQLQQEKENKENIKSPISNLKRCTSAPGSVKRALSFEDTDTLTDETLPLEKATDLLFSPTFKKGPLQRSFTTSCVSPKIETSSIFFPKVIAFEPSESSETEEQVFSLRTDEKFEDLSDDESSESTDTTILGESPAFLTEDDTVDLSTFEESSEQYSDEYDHDFEALVYYNFLNVLMY